jgi:hypothetical protein
MKHHRLADFIVTGSVTGGSFSEATSIALVKLSKPGDVADTMMRPSGTQTMGWSFPAK